MTRPLFKMYHLLVIFVLTTGLINHVIIIPLILNASGRDAWFAIILTLPPFAIWLYLLLRIIKKTGQQKLFPWLETTFGKKVAFCVTIPLFVYIFMNFFMTFRDTVMWIDVSYLLLTPNTIVAALLLGMVLLIARSGLQPMLFSAIVLLPIVSAAGFFVASGNIPEKDHSFLFPLFEFGWSPIFNGMIYVWGGLFEIILILLIQHRVQGKIRYAHLFILTLILLGLTLGPTIGALTEFGPVEAMRQRYPAFEQWRLLSLGEYVDHLDVLSFFQWMSGAVIRLSFLLFLMVDLFMNENHQKRFLFLVVIVLGFAMVNFIPLSDVKFFELLMNVYYPAIFLFSVLMTFLLLTLAYVGAKKKGGHINEKKQQKSF